MDPGTKQTVQLYHQPTIIYLGGCREGAKYKMNFNDEQDTGIWSACLLQKWESFKVILSVGWEPELNRESKIAFDWNMWPATTGMLQKQK